MSPINATVGVDLGQSRDFTAIVVTERLERFKGQPTDETFSGEPPRLESVHVVRHVERAAIGTPYPAIVERVGRLLEEPTLRCARLVIDNTGVGAPVADLFREAYRDGRCGAFWPRPITITGGNERNGTNVPKRVLVSNLVALAQTGRLQFAEGLALADQLRHELTAFSVKVSRAGNDKYEALREADHDDLVMALALSVLDEHRRWTPRGIQPDGSIIDREHPTLGRVASV